MTRLRRSCDDLVVPLYSEERHVVLDLSSVEVSRLSDVPLSCFQIVCVALIAYREQIERVIVLRVCPSSDIFDIVVS